MKSFDELELPTQLREALKVMKFETPTPIQAKAIPAGLEKRDLIGCAQTGTGKTAAFLIPIVAKMLAEPRGQALVLAPTRELADQIMSVFMDLTRALPELRAILIIGGVDMRKQTRILSQPVRMFIATPGRLLDHLGHRPKLLSETRFLVLDEADRMLDMGFGPQLNAIMKFVPKDRQTMLFSATVPPNIADLGKRILRDPIRISVNPSMQAAPKIDQKSIMVPQQKKNEVLLEELVHRKGSILIFTRTKSRTTRVTKFLDGYGVPVACIHGGRTQAQRRSAIDGFKAEKIRVLVATDVVARGIDVSHIEHVINYDLPQDPEDYIHRIGRTGRAGKSGQALSLICNEEKSAWAAITRMLAGGSVTKPSPEKFKRPERRGAAGSGGQRRRFDSRPKQSESRGANHSRPSSSAGSAARPQGVSSAASSSSHSAVQGRPASRPSAEQGSAFKKPFKKNFGGPRGNPKSNDRRDRAF
jgi:superfamily II DNA/RNA helicase